MDVEKNSTSSVYREENEFFSFGGSETQKITRSSNSPIKATLFWPRHESGRVTGAGHDAWTRGRKNHGCDGLTVSRRPLA